MRADGPGGGAGRHGGRLMGRVAVIPILDCADCADPARVRITLENGKSIRIRRDLAQFLFRRVVLPEWYAAKILLNLSSRSDAL